MDAFAFTAILVGFVASGGLYIFYPDIKQSVTSHLPKKSKKEQPKESLSRADLYEVYRKHYTEEDEVLEAVARMKKRKKPPSQNGALNYEELVKYATTEEVLDIHGTFEDARMDLERREESFLDLLEGFQNSKESFIRTCPLCNYKNHLYANRVVLNCSCNQNRFREKMMNVLKELPREFYGKDMYL